MKTVTSHILFLGNLLALGLFVSSMAYAAENGSTSPGIELEDTNWQLLQMKVLGGFLFTAEDPSKYRLNFRSENRLTGTSDCNTITGSWYLENSALRFEPFVSTRKLCPPGSLHNNLVLILRDISAIEMRDGHMILTTGADELELEFEARGF